MKFKQILTCLKEGTIMVEVKTKLLTLLEEKKEDIKKILELKTHEASDKYKEKVVDFIMAHIKVGFPMSLFKGKIKKTIEKNYNKIEEFIITQIEKI